MKKYVQPEMEIDLFEDNSGLLTANSSAWDCVCDGSLAHGSGKDPFDD